MKTRHNPERRAWRGKSHKKGRVPVKQLRDRTTLEEVIDTAPVFSKRYMDACTELDILDA